MIRILRIFCCCCLKLKVKSLAVDSASPTLFTVNNIHLLNEAENIKPAWTKIKCVACQVRWRAVWCIWTDPHVCSNRLTCFLSADRPNDLHCVGLAALGPAVCMHACTHSLFSGTHTENMYTCERRCTYSRSPSPALCVSMSVTGPAAVHEAHCRSSEL